MVGSWEIECTVVCGHTASVCICSCLNCARWKSSCMCQCSMQSDIADPSSALGQRKFSYATLCYMLQAHVRVTRCMSPDTFAITYDALKNCYQSSSAAMDKAGSLHVTLVWYTVHMHLTEMCITIYLLSHTCVGGQLRLFTALWSSVSLIINNLIWPPNWVTSAFGNIW